MFLKNLFKSKNRPRGRVDESIEEVRLWVRGMRQEGEPPVPLSDLFVKVGERDGFLSRPDKGAELRKEPVRVYPDQVPSVGTVQWE